ncbi:alpha-mannosidase [Vagococcus sp. DIV0080]|uniref:Alpha-mannosidase n=1 Tax=Candidatus Vagococcus giribetii TaxID=2230876 RepID=A0ABS3HV37_9ENTE|nr:glycoside hydrolase family 38 C-terminal domain-containing protein [Vagococcus sp. DIV0080]MBO0476706.1 alpha-mannosidase [Vagococcus sp. DIV0080]
MKKKVHVIHHTHWDFEWYFTNHESFIQLTYHLDEVMNALETNMIDVYLLDGQLSILDEYLQSFPDQEERIKQLVTSGKLIIGPWYTQTDELIVAGESIVRNLDLGISLAEKLGGYFNVGYLPDSFGQGKDMPKIYNGFGMDKTVFWRGVPNYITEDREFFWSSEDGSEVLASNIKNGYFIGGGLIYSDDAQGLMKTIEEGAPTDQLVLPVGGDQRYVDYNLRERIELFNNELEDYELVESSYDTFFDSLDTTDLQHVSGEFISSSVSKIHRSIYSSRYDHKYMNDKIERRLIYQLEPLMLMAKKQGIPYKQGLLDRIWKLLSKNQAHDSAGGCNSDKTNKIILDRFIEADQLSYSAVDYLTRKLAESRAVVCENDLLLFNTLPYSRKKIEKIAISIESEYFNLEYNGEKIPYQLIRTTKENAGSIRKKSEDMDPNKFYFIHDILIDIEVPALSFVELTIIERNEPNETSLNVTDEMIENNYYQISLVNGDIELKDKKANIVYDQFISIEDSGDEGDTYDYSPPEEDKVYKLDFSNTKITTIKGKLQETLEIQGKWQLPKDLAARVTGEVLKEIKYVLTLSLESDSNYINGHLVIDNTVLDHRMRLLIKSNMSNKLSYSNTPFGTVEREVIDPYLDRWKELGWREEPTSIFPMLNYVNVHNDETNLTVFSKGIKEYQLVGDSFETVALTLFRSVGFLGRPDLIRRPGIASGNEFKYVPTPDSQLEKRLSFKFGIQLADYYDPSQLMKEFQQQVVTLPFYQIQELNRFTTTLKYFVSNPLLHDVVKQEMPTIELEKLNFSSIRQSRDGKGIEIRVYNPNLVESVSGSVIELPQATKWHFVNLKGDQLTEPRVNDKIEIGIVKPGEIKTIKLY